MGTQAPSSTGKFFIIAGSIIALLASIVGLMTNGFTAWDKFKSLTGDNKDMVFDITFKPFIIKIDSAFNDSIDTTDFFIQTSNGSYKIEKIAIDSLIVTNRELFTDTFDLHKAKVLVKSINLERTILDSRIPEEHGSISFTRSFILDGAQVGSLGNRHVDEELGNVVVETQYSFAGETRTLKKHVPVKLVN